jgi:hypothetical protein
MDLTTITQQLLPTYKIIDIRLIAVRDISEIAFLRIYFSKDSNIHKKNENFFNSISEDIRFVHEILDITSIGDLIAGFEEGKLVLRGNTYEISTEESNYLNGDLENTKLYSKWVQDLYARAEDFPLLLIRPPSSMTCSRILSSNGISNSIKGYDSSHIEL